MTGPAVQQYPDQDLKDQRTKANVEVLDDDVDDDDVVDDIEDDDLGTPTGALKQARTPVQDDSQTNEATAEELARFRAEWKADLNMRLKQAWGEDREPPQRADVLSSLVTITQDPASPTQPKRIVRPPYYPVGASHAPGPSRGPGITEPLHPTHAKALDIYRQAVAHEQRSEVDEALRLYKQAFRIHDDVARLYERLEFHSLQIKRVDGPRAAVDPAVASVANGLDKLHLSSDAAGGVAVTLPANHGVVTGTIANLIAKWTSDALKFEPEDETQPVHLQTLPDELLVHMLDYLDTMALERFALVNRKARVLTLDSTLWRRFVMSIYKPPQIDEEEDLRELVMNYKGDYRRFYIEHPRVRLDGVFIAVCHYLRDGLSENAWVNVSHLITYHRYLRFYPNGDVLSLLANEEVAPQQVIPLLKPTLRMKGFFIGQWRLEGTTVFITDLMDPSGATPRYTFQMILELKSRPLGRWNRLDFVTYDSVSISTGEATPLALKNDRPFWFSKVRSYATV